jgi:SOS-response transcriptional repressor LexA/DNA-binding Xre family transcriptional regulator
MDTYLDRIKLRKAELKLTNDQLAERSGIPLGTLSKILAGMSDSPKLATMISLCGALDCSVEYIVSGTPENTNNYTLNAEEIQLIEDYRKLDRWGVTLVNTILEKELERVGAGVAETVEPVARESSAARVLRPINKVSRYAGDQRARTGKRPIKLFELPVSAGVGVYLDDAQVDTISIPNTDKTADADYALRISGNSMEPKYQSGDVLLVQSADAVEQGEMGIFLLDGSGYFKVFGGDRLLSLNPEYGPIMLKDFSDVHCKGRVVGKLKRK